MGTVLGSQCTRIQAIKEENWLLLIDEWVEFEKQPVEVQDFKKVTNHFRGIYRIQPN